MDLLELIPQFGNLAFTIAAFVTALLSIIFVHEFGHYIIGRWSGIKADVFSLGFGPVLWARVDQHGTKWQLAAIPFGGYVKFRGDSNAASAKDEDAIMQLTPEELRETMHGAPLWARASTVAAGPIANFMLAVAVFMGLALYSGNVKEPLTVSELLPLPSGTYDLQVGDQIIEIAGIEIADLDAMEGLQSRLPIQETLPYVVIRDGQEIEITGPFTYPPMVNFLIPRGAAYHAGLEVGDVITKIDGDPIIAFSQLKQSVESSEGRDLALTVWREGDLVDITLTPRRLDEPQEDGSFETYWRIGVALDFMFEVEREFAGFGDSISYGFTSVLTIITDTMSGLYNVITGTISTCYLTGPVGIAETSGAMASQGLDDFIYFLAFLSTAIGFMNLLPIPVLDGGHLVFHVYEATVGRPPNERIFRVLMSIGLVFVMGFMIFALGNDVACSS